MNNIKIESFEQLQSLVDQYGIENLECHGTPYFGSNSFWHMRLGRLIKAQGGYGYESVNFMQTKIAPLAYWSPKGMAINDLHVCPLIELNEKTALEVNGQLDIFLEGI